MRLLAMLACALLAWIGWLAANAPRQSRSRQAGIPSAIPSSNPPPPSSSSTITAIARHESTTEHSASTDYPRPVQTALEAQIALERSGLSPGSLDGRIGSQSRSAIRAFQRKEHVPITGELDAETRLHLTLKSPALGTYVVTSNDLARLQPLSPTWAGKAQQSALDYESILELVAEKQHSHPLLIRRLNPSLNWSAVVAGTALRVPDVTCAAPPTKAGFVRISLADKTLEAFDPETNLLVHFPCSIARRVEKRPVGELHVVVVVPDPNYTFDPSLFPESVEAQHLDKRLILPPGPDNPVGTVWIGLDKPGYGIHGTPNPEHVGRTESHGCFRLANWNAELLANLVWAGMPVYVEQ